MSIGDICKSRVWISFHRSHFAWWRWYFSFAPTYVGTVFGLHIGTPVFTVLGHIRKVQP